MIILSLSQSKHHGVETMAITKPLNWNTKTMPSEILWQILKLEMNDPNSLKANRTALGLVFGKAKMLELIHKKDARAFMPPEDLINELIKEHQNDN